MAISGKAKYKITHGIWRITMKQSDSAVWKDLLNIKHVYLQGRIMMVNGEGETDFWHETWCGDVSFYEMYP